MNIFRVSLHPDGFARRTFEFSTNGRPICWASFTERCFSRGDQELDSPIEEVSAYPDVVAMGEWRASLALEEPKILVPFRVDLEGTELSLRLPP